MSTNGKKTRDDIFNDLMNISTSSLHLGLLMKNAHVKCTNKEKYGDAQKVRVSQLCSTYRVHESAIYSYILLITLLNEKNCNVKFFSETYTAVKEEMDYLRKCALSLDRSIEINHITKRLDHIIYLMPYETGSNGTNKRSSEFKRICNNAKYLENLVLTINSTMRTIYDLYKLFLENNNSVNSISTNNEYLSIAHNIIVNNGNIGTIDPKVLSQEYIDTLKDRIKTFFTSSLSSN